jgi:hypothetical protein
MTPSLAVCASDTATSSAVLYPNVDASTERRWPLQKLTTGAVTAAFSFDEVIAFRFVVFSRLIIDSIDDGM